MEESANNLFTVHKEENIDHVNEINATLDDKHEDTDHFQEELNESLLTVSKRGHASIADSFLLIGAEVNCRDHDNRTPLIHAVIKGCTATGSTLLSHGAQVELTDSRHWNALLYATQGGHYNIVETLLMAKSDVNFATKCSRETALTLASQRGKDDLVRLLLNYKANIDHESKSGTALSCAAQGGHIDIVRMLLEAGAQTESGNGQTPLMLASYCHHVQVMKLLLEYKANVNHEHNIAGGRCTPLIYVLFGSNLNPEASPVNPLLFNDGLLPSQRWIQDVLFASRTDREPSISKPLLASQILIQNGADIRKVPTFIIKFFLYQHMGLKKPDRSTVPHQDCENSTCIVSFLYAVGAQIQKCMYRNADYRDKMPQFIIEDLEKSMFTLQCLCRRRIREYLLSPTRGDQKNLYIAVPLLPLPVRLKKYMLFDINI